LGPRGKGEEKNQDRKLSEGGKLFDQSFIIKRRQGPSRKEGREGVIREGNPRGGKREVDQEEDSSGSRREKKCSGRWGRSEEGSREELMKRETDP